MDIRNEIKRMGFEIDMKVKRIRQEALKQEEILTGEFKKAKFNRAKAAEMSIAERIVLLINQIHSTLLMI